MQAMALISGQHYMREISKQLKDIESKLEKLIAYHHDEKIGILKRISREVADLTVKLYTDATDIIACQEMVKPCDDIYFEYLTRLERADINAEKRWFNKPKELKELGTSIDESEMDFSIQMCYQASLLREKCKLVEIAVRMKISKGQENIITEKIENLRLFINDAFHRNIQSHIDTLYAPVLAKAEEISEEKRIPFLFEHMTDEAKNIKLRKDSLTNFYENGNEESLARQMLNHLTEPKETLVLLGEAPDSQKVFVLDDE